MAKLNVVSALAALLACASVSPVYAQHTSQGSWVWVNRSGGHASQQNQATFKVNQGNRTARYCYDDKCWNVTLVVRGNAYTFSTNGADFFEFESGSPDDMIGRFWSSSGRTAGAPDAIFRSR
jgi:hypothetical protein